MPDSIKLPMGPALARALGADAFLKGPVPWAWLTAAGALPGSALQVGLALWFWSGIKRTRTVQLSLSSVASDFKIDRATASRGLAALAAAGLVAVDRRVGRRANVTILVLGAPRLARLDAQTVLVVHDEVVVEAPQAAADEVQATVEQGMVEGMAVDVTSVPIVVEADVRRTWAGKS